jgi:hypothetical protein
MFFATIHSETYVHAKFGKIQSTIPKKILHGEGHGKRPSHIDKSIVIN